MDGYGFNNELYLEGQIAAIQERVAHFGCLYLECGGKLLDDQHAVRVLPGYDPDTKVQVMQSLGDNLEVVICISAHDVEHRKVRGAFGPTYDVFAIDLVNKLRKLGIYIRHAVITLYQGQPSVAHFRHMLEDIGLQVTLHQEIPGYPNDIDFVVSPQGMGKNPYIPTTRPIVVITGPGPGSGKLGTCLSQLYHEHQRGKSVGYAKLESFPVWNLPLNHPLNIAYEAATAELSDRNMIDPFHLQVYNEACVNYNRDIAAFPVLRVLLERLTGNPSFYASPTDMGVNRIKDGIVDEKVIHQACCQEVAARYFHYKYACHAGYCDEKAVRHIERLLFQLNIRPEIRAVVPAARKAAQEAKQQRNKGNKGIYCAGALQLEDGTLIVGKNGPQLHAASALILNAVKKLLGLPDEQLLLPQKILQRISYLKQNIFGDDELSLDLEEMLIALSSASEDYPNVHEAVQCLIHLRGCQVHLTRIPTAGDAIGLRKLGVHTTCDCQ